MLSIAAVDKYLHESQIVSEEVTNADPSGDNLAMGRPSSHESASLPWSRGMLE